MDGGRQLTVYCTCCELGLWKWTLQAFLGLIDNAAPPFPYPCCGRGVNTISIPGSDTQNTSLPAFTHGVRGESIEYHVDLFLFLAMCKQ
jgi:hypothetical protein